MANRREIDERDIDRLLAALTDRQIAELFGMSEVEVSQLRRAQRPNLPTRQQPGMQHHIKPKP